MSRFKGSLSCIDKNPKNCELRRGSRCCVVRAHVACHVSGAHGEDFGLVSWRLYVVWSRQYKMTIFKLIMAITVIGQWLLETLLKSTFVLHYNV